MSDVLLPFHKSDKPTPFMMVVDGCRDLPDSFLEVLYNEIRHFRAVQLAKKVNLKKVDITDEEINQYVKEIRKQIYEETRTV
ncbi:MAG: hypothetical protein K2X48_03880 [Chitinophagaceae bacterium]|nr:hypothetical protein [Chitinophagaceae bacterium]